MKHLINIKILIVFIVIVFCPLFMYGVQLDSETEDYFTVRQIPGSETLVKDYFSGDSGVVYVIIYPPAGCPRCEAVINPVYSKLKEKCDNQVILLSDYGNEELAEKYNRDKGYKADKYIYDNNRKFLEFLSFNTGFVHIVYLLKIDLTVGKLMIGMPCEVVSDEFFDALVDYDKYSRQHKYELNYNNRDTREYLFEDDLYSTYSYEIILPDTVKISEILYRPAFKESRLIFNDKLRNSILLFELDKCAQVVKYHSEIKSTPKENKTFVTVPDWYYDSELKNGSLYFIALTPTFSAQDKIVVSYSLPNLFVEGEKDGKLTAVGYRNNACWIVRSNDNKQEFPLVTINPHLNEGYFYRHFTYAMSDNRLILSCKKMTWPLGYERDHYINNQELNPFCDAFYGGDNPIFAMFDTNTGELITRFGKLDAINSKSKTGYYFVEPICDINKDVIAYSDGESGHIYVADVETPNDVKYEYSAFCVDVDSFPSPDESRFYSNECVEPYLRYIFRHIEDLKLTDDEIHCIVRYGNFGLEHDGDKYSYVVINRKTKEREEYKLNSRGLLEIESVGLLQDDKYISPYFITKKGDKYFVEVFDRDKCRR